MEVLEITVAETLIVRRKVLWPNKPVEFCQVEGDDRAKHFGVLDHGQLVSVASLYFDDDACELSRDNSDIPLKAARLRKFATLPDYQRRGVGSRLFQHMLNYLQDQDVHYLWFDARESAIDFYARFGFKVEGKRFYKVDIAYLKMSKKLSIKD